MIVTKALIVDMPHVERILSGHKSWEMRSTGTKTRGRIALIRKGSGMVVGTVEIVDSIGPLTEDAMIDNISQHMVTSDRIKNGDVVKYKYAWVLRAPERLALPVAYDHPNGAVIWVNLQPAVSAKLENRKLSE